MVDDSLSGFKDQKVSSKTQPQKRQRRNVKEAAQKRTRPMPDQPSIPESTTRRPQLTLVEPSPESR